MFLFPPNVIRLSELLSYFFLVTSELATLRSKVAQLEKQIAIFEGNIVKTESSQNVGSLTSLQSFPPDALLNELQLRIANEKEATAEDSDRWTKRLLEFVSCALCSSSMSVLHCVIFYKIR